MRLFIGIALPDEAQEALLLVRARFSSEDGGLRWQEPASWHVTLQFLGSASDEQAACAGEKLRAVRAARVPVRVEGLGFFERAGVFWAGVALTPELLALQQAVVAATRGCGFAAEERAYRPHITLARAKGRGGARALGSLREAVDNAHAACEPRADKDWALGGWVRAAFVAEEFVLYESVPGPEGSRYEPRGSFALG